MKQTILSFFALVFTWTLGAQDFETFFAEADQFFKTYVKNDKVDYQSIHANSASLDNLVQQIANMRFTPSDKVPLHRDKNIKAFYINVYNLMTIKGVIDAYPISSPMEVKGFFDKKRYDVCGDKVTLNDIENGIIRPTFQDARIHFVLVCGVISCPPIIARAYLPATLDKQMDEQTAKAMDDPSFIRPGNGEVAISKIFDWYTEDFGKSQKDLIKYINGYRTQKLPESDKIKYYEYDWTLNAQ